MSLTFERDRYSGQMKQRSKYLRQIKVIWLQSHCPATEMHVQYSERLHWIIKIKDISKTF